MIYNLLLEMYNILDGPFVDFIIFYFYDFYNTILNKNKLHWLIIGI